MDISLIQIINVLKYKWKDIKYSIKLNALNRKNKLSVKPLIYFYSNNKTPQY